MNSRGTDGSMPKTSIIFTLNYKVQAKFTRARHRTYNHYLKRNDVRLGDSAMKSRALAV